MNLYNLILNIFARILSEKKSSSYDLKKHDNNKSNSSYNRNNLLRNESHYKIICNDLCNDSDDYPSDYSNTINKKNVVDSKNLIYEKSLIKCSKIYKNKKKSSKSNIHNNTLLKNTSNISVPTKLEDDCDKLIRSRSVKNKIKEANNRYSLTLDNESIRESLPLNMYEDANVYNENLNLTAIMYDDINVYNKFSKDLNMRSFSNIREVIRKELKTMNELTDLEICKTPIFNLYNGYIYSENEILSPNFFKQEHQLNSKFITNLKNSNVGSYFNNDFIYHSRFLNNNSVKYNGSNVLNKFQLKELNDNIINTEINNSNLHTNPSIIVNSAIEPHYDSPRVNYIVVTNETKSFVKPTQELDYTTFKRNFSVKNNNNQHENYFTKAIHYDIPRCNCLESNYHIQSITNPCVESGYDIPRCSYSESNYHIQSTINSSVENGYDTSMKN